MLCVHVVFTTLKLIRTELKPVHRDWKAVSNAAVCVRRCLASTVKSWTDWTKQNVTLWKTDQSPTSFICSENVRKLINLLQTFVPNTAYILNYVVNCICSC